MKRTAFVSHDRSRLLGGVPSPRSRPVRMTEPSIMTRMPCSPGSNYRRFVETNGRETYPVWCGFFVSPGNRVVPKKGWRYFVAEWHCCHGQVAPLFAERHPSAVP